MKEKLKRIVNSKLFHSYIIILIIVLIIVTVAFIILKYNVEGETNMPFELSKISVISTSEGIDSGNSGQNKWEYDIYQINDIYVYIDKNSEYAKTETISEVCIENFKIESQNTDNIKIYKPNNSEEKKLFKCKDENMVNHLKYESDLKSNTKEMKISNQGGMIAFRCSNNNIVKFASNDEELNHTELLKKANVNKELLDIKLKFDLIIKLDNGIGYKSTIDLKLPVGDVIEQGTSSVEDTELKDIIFKRIKN